MLRKQNALIRSHSRELYSLRRSAKEASMSRLSKLLLLLAAFALSSVAAAEPPLERLPKPSADVGGSGDAPAEPSYNGKRLSQWLEALSDKDPKTRRRAAEILGLGPFGAAPVPALVDALQDEDAGVR